MTMKIREEQIGDGKLPNKYWVSISNDYMYNSGGNSFDWISDLNLFKCTGKTLQCFCSWESAIKRAREIYLGQNIDGIVVNCIHIEDRLSGQVYENCRFFNPIDGSISEEERTDRDFSIRQETELKAGK